MDWKARVKRFCRGPLSFLAGNLLMALFSVLAVQQILACGDAANGFMAGFQVIKAWFFGLLAGLLLVRLYLPAAAEKITFGLLYPRRHLKKAPPPLTPVSSLIACGRTAEAEARLCGVMEEYPGNGEAALMLVELYLDRMDLPEQAAAAAEKYFSAVGKRDKNDCHFRILMRYADLLHGTGEDRRLRQRLESELRGNHLTEREAAVVRRRLEQLQG